MGETEEEIINMLREASRVEREAFSAYLSAVANRREVQEKLTRLIVQAQLQR